MVRFSYQAVGKAGALLLAVGFAVGCGSGAASKSFTSPGPVAPPTTAPAPTPTPQPSPTPAPAPTPAPQPTPGNGNATPPPAGATVMNNIQNQPGWQTCGSCGNDGASGVAPLYNLAQGIASPSLSGSAADFYISGGPAYSGGYYFIEQPTVPNPLSYLRYEFDLYVPSQYANAPQALEFECQENSNGYTYNFAWQADYARNTWRVFNYTTKVWEDAGIPFQHFNPDTWHHLIAIYHAAGTQVVHDSLTVDGVTTAVNIAHQALQTGQGPELTNAFQVNLDGNSTPYHVYVDNMKVTLTD